jgi:hypothetical protein
MAIRCHVAIALKLVLRVLASLVVLIVLAPLVGCTGEETEGLYQVNLQLPADWESIIDMDALPAASSTPYIGTVRFVVESGSSTETSEFPWQSHAGGVDFGKDGLLTVQAIAGGQVIMEGQVNIESGGDAQLTIPLSPSGGFSRAGTLLYPRQNHSVVEVGSDLYVLGGTPDTGVIELLTANGEGFASTAWAASLAYPRVGQEVVYDAAGNRIFVFKGADPVDVEDDVYEVIDLAGAVSARSLESYRADYIAVSYQQEALVISGYANSAMDTWRIDSSSLDFSSEIVTESVLPFLGFASERVDASCTKVGDKLACVGGQEGLNYLDDVVVLNLSTKIAHGTTTIQNGKIGHSLTQISGQEAVIAGGFGQSGYQKEVETLDAEAVSTSIANSLVNPRAFHTATLIDTDKLLIIGGGPTTDTSTSAEIFDLTTNESTLLPWRMRVPRTGHTATLLPDGRVLIVGGSMVDPVMEIWNPPIDP